MQESQLRTRNNMKILVSQVTTVMMGSNKLHVPKRADQQAA